MPTRQSVAGLTAITITTAIRVFFLIIKSIFSLFQTKPLVRRKVLIFIRAAKPSPCFPPNTTVSLSRAQVTPDSFGLSQAQTASRIARDFVTPLIEVRGELQESIWPDRG